MRLIHRGFAALRIEDDAGHAVVIDPHERVGTVDGILLSGGPWAERYAGAMESLSMQRDLPVVASRSVVGWLGGARTMRTPPTAIAQIQTMAVDYPPKEPSGAGLDRLRAALRRPRWARSRLSERRRLPESRPLIWKLDIPHGHRIVHLGLALHASTPGSVLAQAREWIADSESVVVGPVIGEEQALVAQLCVLRPPRVILMDQSNDLRRAAGLPTEPITPIRDQLVQEGIETHVLVSGVSLRFEPDDTVKRW